MDDAPLDTALAEASFRAVLERLPDAVIAVHRGHTILYANSAAGRLFGFDKSTELLGRSVILLIHAEDGDGITERLSSILANGSPSPWRALRVVRRDGAVAHVEVCGTRVAFGGKPTILAVLRTVPDRGAPAPPARAADILAAADDCKAGAKRVSEVLRTLQGTARQGPGSR